jgi:hypothetical protein
MIGFEVTLNGHRLCTAGAGDQGVLSAIVSSVAKRKELSLEIGGLVDDANLAWSTPETLAVGDVVIVRVVEVEHPDPPTTSKRDDRALAETSERKYYELLKKKYGGV